MRARFALRVFLGTWPPPHIVARTSEEGRAGLDSLERLGVDRVKVHGPLTPAKGIRRSLRVTKPGAGPAYGP